MQHNFTRDRNCLVVNQSVVKQFLYFICALHRGKMVYIDKSTSTMLPLYHVSSVRIKCEKYVKPVETTDLISGIQQKPIKKKKTLTFRQD